MAKKDVEKELAKLSEEKLLTALEDLDEDTETDTEYDEDDEEDYDPFLDNESTFIKEDFLEDDKDIKNILGIDDILSKIKETTLDQVDLPPLLKFLNERFLLDKIMKTDYDTLLATGELNSLDEVYRVSDLRILGELFELDIIKEIISIQLSQFMTYKNQPGGNIRSKLLELLRTVSAGTYQTQQLVEQPRVRDRIFHPFRKN